MRTDGSLSPSGRRIRALRIMCACKLPTTKKDGIHRLFAIDISALVTLHKSDFQARLSGDFCHLPKKASH